MASLQDMTRFICLFHSADRARAAVAALENAGISSGSIQTLDDASRATTSGSTEDLLSIGVPERDVKHLQDGLRQGGVLVSLEAPEEQSEQVEKIFHKYNADKIDEADLAVDNRIDDALAAAPLAASTSATTVPSGDEVVIPVTEETLEVGKRSVDRGGVRVLRHTVEQPVSEDVTLHGERVVLEYREVNRPATEADVLAGQQQIELVETAEVPVVQKVARVVEEVHVGKVESDHTETIRDSVRHTEVDIEPVDGPTDRGTYRD